MAANAQLRPSYAREVQFDQPPETVYQALTTPEGLAAWWAPVSGSGGVGGELSFHIRHQDSLRLRVSQAEPSRAVRWEVQRSDTTPEWAGTTIAFALSPRPGGGTTLSFEHEGLTAELDCYDMCRGGWDFYLSSLRDRVDAGAGRPAGRSAAGA